MEKGRVLLAYSGGLNTSCILKWLLDKGYEVICFIADVGQNDDFRMAKEKAMKIGAKDVIVKDVKSLFVENFIWPAIRMGLIYEKRHLLGTSLARPCITLALIDTAKEFDCHYISHGATGKGNGQICFELSAYALNPDIKVITPWRDTEFFQRFHGRNELSEYAKSHNLPIGARKKSMPWSTDANLMHVSYESGVLEDPSQVAPDELFQITQAPVNGPDTPCRLEIVFHQGFPVRCIESSTGKNFEDPVHMLQFLNQIGGEYSVGRSDIVENRYDGLKSRGVYETPGARILFDAHQDIEIYILDREVLRVKSFLADKMSDYVYNGFWYSPEAEYVRKCIEESQKNVNGRVTVEIFKGNCTAVARESVSSLYNQEFASMNIHGTLNPSAAGGFIEMNSIRLKEYFRLHKETPNNTPSRLKRRISRMELN